MNWFSNWWFCCLFFCHWNILLGGLSSIPYSPCFKPIIGFKLFAESPFSSWSWWKRDQSGPSSAQVASHAFLGHSYLCPGWSSVSGAAALGLLPGNREVLHCPFIAASLATVPHCAHSPCFPHIPLFLLSGTTATGLELHVFTALGFCSFSDP